MLTHFLGQYPKDIILCANMRYITYQNDID